MDVPLGYAIGNALEVAEAIEILHGNGCPALREICIALAANMYSLSFDVPADEAVKRAAEALDSGLALAKFREWIAAQGGDPACADNPAALGTAKYQKYVSAPQGGYIARMDAEQIGRAAMLLGAGRATKTDIIDPSAGIRLAARTGDRCSAGDVLATLCTNDEAKLAAAEAAFLGAISFTDTAPAAEPLIYCTVGN